MSAEEEFDGAEDQFPAIQQQANQVVNGPAEVPYVPALPDRPTDVLDLDNVLAFTQNVRLGAIKTLNHALKQGVDSETVNALLKAASDMDKAVVNRRRVGIEEEAAKTSEQTQRDTAAILRSLAGKANAFRLAPDEVDPNRRAPSLDSTVALPEGVPDETAIGTQQMTYDGFAKENGFQAPQS